ncbi:MULTISPECIES: biopolymer transporter ExbD [unclassified Leptolyngbya]|uniref:ExbD/TolR family protein n=1 Tax=unclassified Leptolyngbya TaxID=2650499 RepID=UPI0016897A2F|nr:MULTISPECIES: biopolymer transporter ExbD [unclassified Leptolyngbya]MBD1913821.1 biopolymer transporter ExbD [Leptolyngbya sp. FACHB-8]MBD2156540.1 biopolymer transporter ExbD [Leptolyngbya sp. FACHB-16]
MAFRKRQRAPMPELNLVPMMDVLMTVLTFFIIVSMTLRSQQMTSINLPGVKSENEFVENVDTTAPALVVGLDANGQLLLAEKPASVEQLAQAMTDHYTQYPDGVVLLKADRTLDFRQVSQTLKMMRDIGGDRVSLAIGKEGS